MKHRRLVWAAAGLTVFEMILHQAWHHIDDNDSVPGIDQQLAFLSAVTVFLLPHILASMAKQDRQSLLLPAGLIGLVLTIASSISPVVLLVIPTVLVPSIFYLVHWAIGAHRPTMSPSILPLLMVPAAIAAAFVLLATEDPRCYVEVQRGDKTVSVLLNRQQENVPSRLSVSCSSDVVALHESGASLFVTGLIINIGWRFGYSSSRLQEAS